MVFKIASLGFEDDSDFDIDFSSTVDGIVLKCVDDPSIRAASRINHSGIRGDVTIEFSISRSKTDVFQTWSPTTVRCGMPCRAFATDIYGKRFYLHGMRLVKAYDDGGSYSFYIRAMVDS